MLTWKLLFYTKSRLGFLFSNIWMLEVLYWRKKTQNIINIIHRIVLQLYSMYSHFLSGTWNKHAEYTLLLCFFVFVIDMLSAWNRKLRSMDPSCFLTSSDFVCTVCIFSKAFEADHKSIGLPVKEAGLVYLLATRHLCNCRVVCCALVLLKHPIKHTVVGLWENARLCLGFVFDCSLKYSLRELLSCHTHTEKFTVWNISSDTTDICFSLWLILLYLVALLHLSRRSLCLQDISWVDLHEILPFRWRMKWLFWQ